MNHYSFKRIINSIVSLTISLILILTCVGTAFADTGSSTAKGIIRLSGKDRYATSLKVADELKKELGVKKFDNIVVATGKEYADALSGTYLAAVKKAPIILVHNTNNAETLNYIKNSIVSDGTIYILGGTGVVSKSMEASLKKIATTKRLAGSNRYETNLKILEEANPKKTDLLICSGKTFADALSASATGKPILLVGDSLTQEQNTYLTENKSKLNNCYIIGGSGAVNKTVENGMKKYKSTKRISGDNRYSTAVALAKKFFTNVNEIVLTTGNNFPDGLTGGVLANAKKAPLLLTTNSYKFMYAYHYVVRKTSAKAATILGGPLLVSDDASGLTNKGAKKYGLLSIGSDLYYAYDDGSIAKNRFVDANGKRYYATSEWKIAKNTLFQAGGKTYGATPDGFLIKNTWGKAGALTYYFNNDYTVNNICLKAKRKLNDIGYDLSEAYEWIGQTFRYYDFSYKTSWGSLWFADFGLEKEYGECTVIASTFYVFAKMLGYDAKQVQGYVSTVLGNHIQHSWVFITENGEDWLYDPECYVEINRRVFKSKPENEYWHYHDDYETMTDTYEG